MARCRRPGLRATAVDDCRDSHLFHSSRAAHGNLPALPKQTVRDLLQVAAGTLLPVWPVARQRKAASVGWNGRCEPRRPVGGIGQSAALENAGPRAVAIGEAL